MKSVRAIRGILFDKDGTLVDFYKTWFAIGTHMALLAADGDGERADELMAIAGYDAVSGGFRADSAFAAGTNADIVALWYPHLSAAGRLERVSAFDQITAEEAAATAVPVDRCKETITELHRLGLRLGLATNDSTSGAERTLLALGIAQMFDAAFGYDAVANPKPAPDVIYAFADMTGLRPSEIAMVGDNRHDLDTGKAAGAGLVIGVLSGTGTRETLAGADVLLDSIADLPAFLSPEE